MNRAGRAGSGRLLGLGIAAGLVAGCAADPGEPGTGGAPESIEAQQVWLGQRIDESFAVLGGGDGWYRSWPDVHWTSARDEILRGAPEEACRTLPLGAPGWRLRLRLVSTASIERPLADATRLRAAWNDAGWTVSDVTSAAPGSPPHADFRADRPDGSGLAHFAVTGYLRLDAVSPCSARGQTPGSPGLPLATTPFPSRWGILGD